MKLTEIPDKERQFILQYLMPELEGAKCMLNIGVKTRERDVALNGLKAIEREVARIRSVIENGMESLIKEKTAPKEAANKI